VKLKVFILFLAATIVGCEGDNHLVTEEGSSSSEEIVIVQPHCVDTSMVYQREAGYSPRVRIRMPKEPFRGTILVLQGWNFANSSWSDSSNLDSLASAMGFALVLPEMGKSIYHKRNYKETRADWRSYPTRSWLMDTMVYDLQQRFQLFLPEHQNFVMGISTGGRGALLVAQEHPNIFNAGASLSGDYDQSSFPTDNLYRGFFGAASTTWSGSENPVAWIDTWSVPMYIAHGARDSVVSVAHMNRLRNLQVRQKPELNFTYHLDSTAGHNYKFWTPLTLQVLRYFNAFL
jgi:S-formylglutathione hydrolase FrmB